MRFIALDIEGKTITNVSVLYFAYIKYVSSSVGYVLLILTCFYIVKFVHSLRSSMKCFQRANFCLVSVGRKLWTDFRVFISRMFSGRAGTNVFCKRSACDWTCDVCLALFWYSGYCNWTDV